LIVLDKIVAYEQASSAFYQAKIERWMYEWIEIINIWFGLDIHFLKIKVTHLGQDCWWSIFT
jgi:hypothetical protein